MVELGGQMVDNPRRAWLQSLLSSIDTTLAAMRPVLDKPASDFGGGKAWIGTDAATRFQADLTGRRNSVHTLTDGLRDVVQNALRAEPLQVTEGQARQMRMDHEHGW
ncbi:hypothetical protein RVR_4051 [Actinacidiphila reveromycinica]|uniref:Uncharacterized protein n=1 Tax=Actinacidiphila reveromycinica TaxID=659352 RepID=A0A7U3USX2_9ACTN|nr:hypothetical protein [Streptomyces sp. SN-593]BBA98026.1 hypothetical protein RVR_4051 [Streptomyces sp. SN-593]